MKNLKQFIVLFILRITRKMHILTTYYSDSKFDSETCIVCGENKGVIKVGVLWPGLIIEWGLSASWANWMDQREGLQCASCKSNLRSIQLAKAILLKINDKLNIKALTFLDLCETESIQKLKIAEINSAGTLHPYLSKIRSLYYSEYGSESTSIPSEDLLDLSYPDDFFDLVVNSDVLEHVPDVSKALAEIKRVLKPDGYYIFSIPVIWVQRHTRQRAKLHNSSIRNISPPSYHGSKENKKNDFLVFYEFGEDFIDICKDSGLILELVKDTRNPSLVTFIATKNDYPLKL